MCFRVEILLCYLCLLIIKGLFEEDLQRFRHREIKGKNIHFFLIFIRKIKKSM